MKLPTHTFAASRFLCPVEMLLGLCSVAWGLSGGMLQGHLWNVLALRGENGSWMFVLMTVGGLQFAIALIEWVFGRKWQTWSPSMFVMTVHRSVFMRAALSFLTLAMWVYIVSTLCDSDGTRSIGALWVMSPTAIIFSIWTFYENQKVYCAIDPHYNTASTLSFRR